VLPDRDWVQFDLVGGARPGGEPGWSNRSAIGATLRLLWTNEDGQKHQQLQVVTAGDGYASQGMLRLHFGLGSKARIEKAVIQWPSRRSQTILDPQVRQLLKIEEAGS
jgi:hypothetical protein